MNQRLIFPAFFLFLLLLSPRSSGFFPLSENPQSAITSRELMTQMIKAIKEIKTLKYDLKISERIEGDQKNYSSSIKLQCAPRKLYIYVKGAEVLWLEGKNGGDALVNPGSFPYINLNLDPAGSLMTADQHHTIHEIGFDYFKGIIENTIARVGDKFEKYFFYQGEEKFDGKPAYKVTILNNDFAFVPYTVKKNETLQDIARKFYVSEYMIKENNKKVKSYTDVKEGQEILIPNGYAKMTVMYIDKQYMVPLLTRVYDNKGLFESYEYLNLQVNPKFADDEFTKEFKDYHF